MHLPPRITTLTQATVRVSTMGVFASQLCTWYKSMWSVPSRRRESSTARMMFWRELPMSQGFLPVGKKHLVATRNGERSRLVALVAERHRPQAETRNLEAGAAEPNVVHAPNLLEVGRDLPFDHVHDVQ